MIPRVPAFPVPSGDRYWVHDLASRGEHHFRMPRYTLALGLSIFAAEAGAVTKEGYASSLMAHIPVLSAAIGLAWHNRGIALVTPPPELFDAATLRAYAGAVEDELQDSYDMVEIEQLGTAALAGIIDRLNVAEMAGARALGFPLAVEPPPEDPERIEGLPSARKRSNI